MTRPDGVSAGTQFFTTRLNCVLVPDSIALTICALHNIGRSLTALPPALVGGLVTTGTHTPIQFSSRTLLLEIAAYSPSRRSSARCINSASFPVIPSRQCRRACSLFTQARGTLWCRAEAVNPFKKVSKSQHWFFIALPPGCLVARIHHTSQRGQ